MKLNKNSLANAFGLTTLILWTICSVIVWLFPGFSLAVTMWWMHGMPMEPYRINLQNFLLGGLTMTGVAWATGYVLGWTLEYLGKKKQLL